MNSSRVQTDACDEEDMKNPQMQILHFKKRIYFRVNGDNTKTY